MKKYFVMVLSAVLLVSMFTACESSDAPKESGLTEADLVGDWRVDSASFGGQTTSHVAMIILVRANHELSFNGFETCTYALDGNSIVVTRGEEVISVTYEVVSYSKDAAVLRLKGTSESTYYLSRLPAPTGNEVSISEQNLLGVWKYEYYINRDTEDGKESLSYGAGNGAQTMTFQADGVALFNSEYQTNEEGYWILEGNKILFANGQKPSDVSGYMWQDIDHLTADMLVVSVTNVWDNGIVRKQESYYSRVK